MQEVIDRVIKEVWVSNISKDYKSYFLLKEDTLKNALYYHLRTRLQHFLEEHNLRIYTEYFYKGFVADLAIVKLNDDPGNNEYLKDDVESVLSIIEVKYKSGGSEKPFTDDIRKIKSYIDFSPRETTQYYLAFVHEIEYENIEGDSWLTKAQQKWANDRLTELSGHYIDEEMQWKVLSHNGMNENYKWEYRFTREELSKATKNFNELKYSHSLYHHLLEVVGKETEVTQDLVNAVKYLMYWKLGKISTKKTPSSSEFDLNGKTYYVAETTPQNRQAVAKALDPRMLQCGIEFRKGQKTYSEFKSIVDYITGTSIVLPTFFTHIWKPSEIPILDVKVWRTYKWNKGEILKKHTKPMSWQHYEEYTAFFNGLVEVSGEKWRNVDKGIWVIGEKLKGAKLQY